MKFYVVYYDSPKGHRFSTVRTEEEVSMFNNIIQVDEFDDSPVTIRKPEDIIAIAQKARK